MSASLQRAHSRWALLHRALTWLSALALTLGFFTMGGYLPKAVAYEAGSGTWTAGGVLTMPSALTATIASTGSTALNGVTTLGARGFSTATYTPTNMVTGDSTMDILVNAGTCAATGTCADLGTLTVTFSQPVRNPTLHLSGLGANVGNGIDQSDFHAYLDLTTSGVTMTQASSNGNMTVSGNRITAVNDSTSTTCTTNTNAGNFLPAASTAACGSVKFNGTVTSLSFTMGTIWVKNPNAWAAMTLGTAGDAFAMTVTVPQDFPDAPTSYNGAQAPAHVLSNLALGATVDEDNAATRNATTAPWAAAAANGDDTSGTDDENAFPTLPDVVAQPGASYSLTVPISGLSKSATVCGWIDFNRNGTFDSATEQQCATPAAGATAATLTWTIPSGVSVGETNARFRLGYTAAQVQSPTGLADSGEVEDYPISVLARPQLILTKTTTDVAGGPFTYTVTNSTQESGTATTVAAGTAVQVDGDTSTTGTQAFTPTSVGTPVTITEAALSGWSVTSATCTNASGTVGSASGATYTIPASAVVAGAVITCAYTNARPGLTFDKQAGAIIDLDGNGPDAGDQIPYTFVVTNTGQTSLSGIAVTDPKVTAISCPVTTLAIGGSMSCSALYTLTQPDVTSGSVVNTASISANPPTGAALTASDTDTVLIPANPKITLAKTAGSPTGNTAGSTVTYTFLVTNTGNLPLTTVGVSDPTVGPVTCPVTSLVPGAATTCTKTYALTQANVNAGTLVNTATASGVSPGNVTVTSTSSATINIARSATIALTKTAGTPSGTTAGATLGYSFLVTNTGNVTMTNLTIADNKVTTYTCPTTTLLPAASTTCTGSHTITQAEIDAGLVTNQATASATPPNGMSAPSAYGSTTTTLARNPAITLDKQFSGMTGQSAGSSINYSFVVSNTGNVTLNAIWLLDANVASFSCPTTTLAVGASTTCTGSHTLTQADLDAGHVSNSATVTGYGPNGAPVSATDSVDTTVTPGPGITLTKTAGAPSGNAAGATVAYSFLVKNTGNVTLTSVGVSDPKVGTVSCPATSLSPGATTTCTKTYSLTQADVDAGSVINTATASGSSPTNVTVQATSSTTTTITRTASLAFDKQAGGLSGTTAGSTISYSFVFQNTGNVTLTSPTVSDGRVGSVTCPVTPLAPGGTATCTATYPLSQNDVDSGHVANTATGTATPPSGMTPPTGTDSTDTTIAMAPAISLVKSAQAPSPLSAGSTITYSFLVTNSGNVSLTSIGVTDAKVGPVTCPVATLLPGASTTCTKVYTLTQAEVDAGVVNNTASAAGTPPTGAAVSATSSVSTPITQSPAIALTKSAGAPTAQVAGATIAYSFVVKNTGNVTLTSVGVGDPKVGTVSCPVTLLAPAASTTCTKSYTLTQADVDAGVVNNTATASGKPPTGAAVTGNSSTSTSLTRAPAITLTKTAGAPTAHVAGATIAYSFLVKNTGNVTLTSVGVSDPKVGTVSCPVSLLAPAASTTCTKSYTVTQADVDAGVVNNTATASGTPPTGAAVTAPSSLSTTITRSPAITVDKQAGTLTGSTAGTTLAFSFVVANTGNVTLSGLTISDVKVTGASCPVAQLAPGATTTCTASYALTQTDVDSGHIANTVTASANPPAGAAVAASDSTDTTIVSGPAITLTKTAGAPTAQAAGATITYSFLVKNTGNVTLTSVGVSDPKVGTVSCPVSELAPGASTTCTKVYTLTQVDVDAGVVNNTATASGTPPTGAAVTAISSTSTTITRSPAIALTKQAGTASGNTAGSTIPYTFLVTNTGNVTLASVTVSDAKLGTVSCPATTLLPGASTTCTGTYTLLLADVNLGRVTNTANVSANPPSGSAVTATASVTTTIPSAPSVTLKKQAGMATGSSAGSTIPYTFLVTNTGNVTLTSVAVSDAKVGTVTCPASTLVPGASTTCTATYTLTLADVNTSHVTNTATASANPPSGAAVTGSDTVTTTIASAPSVTLKKQAGTATGNTAGSTIPYTFQVTNTGNVTLGSVAVSDAKVGTVTCPLTTLVPGASTTCTATYTLLLADVNSGHVINTAAVSANPPTGAPVTATDTITTFITATPSISLDKQADAPTGTTAGSTIAYSFVLTNTGNVTLTSVGVTDPKLPAITCLATSLAPGASTTCAKTYTLTQTDVDAGHVANTATAAGTSPFGAIVSGSDSTDTTIATAPAMTLTKSAGVPSGSTPGSTIAYSFLVTNTGNVTLTSVGVSDAKVGAVTCLVTQLAPGASTTCTATYRLTQTDVDAGVVINTASASGTPPTGAAATATSSTSTPVTRSPAITLDKQAGTPSGTSASSTIAYTFIVANAGNVTLTAVGVNDPKAGTVTCPASSLAPNASTTCTATYRLTQTDVDAGHVANTATVSGTSPSTTIVTAQDSTDTTIAATPSIALTKTAGTPSAQAAGGTMTFTFLVTNTGNVTLHSVGVSDPMVGTVTCPVTSLAPGANTTCTKTYSLTQADVDAGVVNNSATASGTSPTNTVVTAIGTTTTTVTRSPAITLVKSASSPTRNGSGGTIAYTFVVENTGNVTLTSVSVADAKVGTVTCPVATLAPSVRTTCTATYTLTQTDVDAGHVANTATASGTPPSGAVVQATSSVNTLIASAPSVKLDKQGGTPSGNTAGSTVPYSFVVTNTGNVTLTGVAIADPKVTGLTCPVTQLAPAASTTCTASHTLTQTDVDAGHVANTATVSANPPTGGGVIATDSVDTTVASTPSITLVKSAGAPTRNAATGTLPYSFVVTNTGNVTLSSIAVSDAMVGAVSCPVASLAPGGSTTCTATYVLTQTDVDAGHVANTATASGTPPTGTAVTATSSVNTPIVAAPSITVEKAAGTASGNTADSTIPYTFLVTNTGNVTVTAVAVSDAKVGTVTCPATSLAPAASTTCTATYRLTQADVDAGQVVNTASASANPPNGAAVTATDSVTTTIASAPSVTLKKQAGTATGNTPGSSQPYSFLVTNTGNVTLTSVAVADAKVGTVTCPVAPLAPGGSTTCTATYVLTLADVDAGHVINTATVSANPPSGAAVTASDSVTTPIASAPAVAVDKQAGTATGSAAGATIPYTFVVSNTGNVTLHAVSVSDLRVGTVTCPATTLASNVTVTCTAAYVLTQVDVDSGHVANTATASGTSPTGGTVTASDSVDTTVVSAPRITLDKQAGTPSGNAVGTTIAYSFKVQNTGNMTVSSLTISDGRVGTITCPATTLAPGATTTCSATYVVTQVDVDAGHVANTATASATPPSGGSVTATDSTDTLFAAAPEITLDKQAGTPSGNTAGSTILYSFLVTNTGNVTLSSVTVDDPTAGTVSCPATTLAPAATTTCTAAYTLTQVDVDAGHVANTATVSGDAPSGAPATATDRTDTLIPSAPSMVLDKVAGPPSGTMAGSTIQYTFHARNTGNVTVHLLSVIDPKVGSVYCPTTVLAPGEATACTATYTLTQADADAGHVANTASVSATPPSGPAVTASDSTDSSITSTPGLTFDKHAEAPSGDIAGSTIAYSFTVTNTGNVTLSGVSVADAKVGIVSCQAAPLSPGGHTHCSAQYTLTQDDVDAGHVFNSATVSADAPSGQKLTADDSVDVPIVRTPGLILDKQAGAPSGVTVGSTILYSFVFTNTGNVTLTDGGILDAKVTGITCPVHALTPGVTTTCTAVYTLTQTDIDAGHVANSATASGLSPSGVVVTVKDSTDTVIASDPSLTIAKHAGTASGNTAGSVLPYTFDVTNTGNVTLTDVEVSDAKIQPVSCPVSTLAPGASTTCSAMYELVQADVDAGHVANSATVSATPPSGDAVTASDSVDTLVPANPRVALDKQSGGLSGHRAGSTLPYSFVVTNTGNVTLTSVTINDPTVGAVDCPATTLAPNTSTSCSATYSLTQDDVDSGHVANTASVSANPPSGAPVASSDSTDTRVVASPGISIAKHAGTASGNTATSTIPYTFDVTNTGELTLTNIAIIDAKVGTVTCPVTDLAPGESTTCTAPYTLSQADVDAGHVSNTATVTSLDPSGTLVSQSDTVDAPIPSNPVVTLDKQAGTATGASAGATIPFSFVVTNAGNVTLSSVTIVDPKIGTVSCPVSTLAPGAQTICTAPYALTQADVNAGHVTNTAAATAEPPSGTVASSTDSTDSVIPANPSLTLDKQAGDPTGRRAGSTIDYSFVVTNTGNVTLSSVGVNDPTVGGVSCPATTLTPGARTTCTRTYTMTQADVDAGVVHNVATASGAPPTGTAVTATDSVDVPIPAAPSITLNKQAGTPSGGTAGSTIVYTFLVTNPGNVTLSKVTISDTMVGTVTCPATSLAPGDSTLCTATYTMTQSDVDSGRVKNTAGVSASSPAGGTVTATSSTTTLIPSAPSLVLNKNAGVPSGTSAGSTIAYTFVTKNTGNVTVHLLGISDPPLGSVQCPTTTLAPGETVTCAATYTMTQADVDAGHVANTATASALPPSGPGVSSTDSTDSLIASTPSITLDKRAGAPSGNTMGSTILYSFVVTNTGNVTLSRVSVDDPTAGPVTCPATTLPPGVHVTCTATYTIMQSDVDAGHVANSASVSAAPPSGDPVTAGDNTDITIAGNPSLSVDKQAGTHLNTVGSTIPYSFVVTNTGNVTLSALGVSDAMVGTVSCPVTDLAPGARTTCTAAYTLTQPDIDAGHVLNTATASGTPPTGAAVSATDVVDTVVLAGPQIALDKSAGAPSSNTVGATIAYTFLVTNTGNVTLNAIGVSDPHVTAVTCPATQLAPGENTSCTATYTVTQADVDAGHVVNTATVSGTPPQGAAVNATDSAATTITASPSITLVKSSGTASGNTAGATIPYSFVVTNTGNVTLHAVSVSDAKVGTVTCPAGDLAPGASATCSATYRPTQADVDLGHVDNAATASAIPPLGVAVTAGDSITTPVPSAPSITVVKTAGFASGNTATSTIPYRFVVTNTGNVTVHAVAVSDPRIATVTCTATQLAPGAQTTCTGTYTLTQVDVDAGHVANSATASAAPPVGGAVTATSAIDTPIIPTQGLTLDKQAGTPTGNTERSTVPYTFLVTNVGSVTLTRVTVNDPIIGTVSCPVTTLAPGAQTTCTATYRLTQADVDAGHVTNSASVTARSPSGTAVTSSDTVDTLIPSAPKVGLVKTARFHDRWAGSTVPYTFVVTNDGNVTLHAIVVTDPKIVEVTCPVGISLAPRAWTMCTGTYSLTQDDVDAGHLANTATASGTPPTGAPVTASASTDSFILRVGQLTLHKTGTALGNTAGSLISYSFLVTNTGNVTLRGTFIDDTNIGPVTCPTTTLAPGASVTCTGLYAMTQDDVDLGAVMNVANAVAFDPRGYPVSTPDGTITPIETAPQMAIVKSAGEASGNSAGSTIPYTFLITNTGNVTLHYIAVSDPLVGSVLCPDAYSLAPAEQTTCTATYALTLADANAGHVANAATVSARSPYGDSVSASDAIDTPITPTPSVDLQKHAGEPSDAIAGGTIDYSLVVANTGNVTLSNITISDPKVGHLTCPVTTLDPNGMTTCSVRYVLTQADIDAGQVLNEASVSATSAVGTLVTADASAETTIPSQSALMLSKTASTPGTTAGSTITYALVVTNTGNVTLGFITVSDPTAGPVTCPDGNLPPSQSTTCSVTYTLTQNDIDAGHIENTAHAYGNPPSGDPVNLDDDATASDTLDTPILQNPSVSIVKSAGKPTAMEAGGVVHYTFRVTNTGNVSLTNVVVADPLIGDVACPTSSLAPTAMMTCTGVYGLTQADIEAGTVANTATVTGVSPSEAVVSATGRASTPLTRAPALTFTKQADATGFVQVGDQVVFTFLVTNTGNVTLSSIVVKDPMLASVSCPQTTLTPAEKLLCTGAPYTVTPTDASRGSITNTAVVSALAAELETTLTELTATATATVSTTKPLPNTGSPIGIGSLSVSLVILGLGIMLTAVGRRRSRGHHLLA